MEEEVKAESKPASVFVPSANEGEGSAVSVDDSILTATKPPKKGAVKASGTCVPDAFYWSVDEVSSWVEDIGFWQYKGCFTENFVDGRKLILMDANSLPRIGIQNFDHIKTICSAIRDVLGIEGPDSKRTIYLPPRDHLATFLETKAVLGPHSDALEFEPLPV